MSENGDSGTSVATPTQGEPAGGEDILAAAGITLDDGGGGEATPDDTNQNQNPNKEKAGTNSEGSPEQNAEKYRKLVELTEKADSESLKLNKTEAKRIQLAAAKGFSTDEEIDEYLAKEGKQNVAAQDGKDKEDQSDSSKAKSDKNEEKDDNVSSSSKETELLKAISPHLKPGETDKAIESIKNLQRDHSVKGEFVNKARQYGIESPEDIGTMVNTLNNIDSDISNRLKSPEGIKQLYDAFKIPIPEWLGQVAANPGGATPSQTVQNNGSQQSQQPAAVEEVLKGLDEDGVITVSQFKELIPQLANSIQSQVASKFTDQQKKLDGVFGYVNQVMQSQQKKANMSAAVNDIKAISSNFGQFAPQLTLESNAQDIIDASIETSNQNGRTVSKVKANPHPEWPKIQAILNLRAKAAEKVFSEAKAQGVQLPANYRPDIISYLSKVFMTKGGIKDATKAAKKQSQKTLISNLSKRVQPNVSDSKTGGANTFKVPKTEADVANMSKDERKRFHQMLASGQLRIGT